MLFQKHTHCTNPVIKGCLTSWSLAGRAKINAQVESKYTYNTTPNHAFSHDARSYKHHIADNVTYTTEGAHSVELHLRVVVQ